MQELGLSHFIIVALAVWRISSIVAYEEFAFGLATKFRKMLGVQSAYDIDDDGNKMLIELDSHLQPTSLARGITCIWCVSFWVSIVMTGLLYLIPGIIYIYTMVAVGTIAIAINKLISG